MRSLPIVRRGNAPALRTSVLRFSNSSRSRTALLIKTISPSFTPATSVTSRFESCTRSVGAAFVPLSVAAGVAAVSAKFVGGAVCWHESSASVVRIETNKKHSLRRELLGMVGLLGRDFLTTAYCLLTTGFPRFYASRSQKSTMAETESTRNRSGRQSTTQVSRYPGIKYIDV